MSDKVNIDFLRHAYFYFDEPVPYKASNGIVNITPISLRDSEAFLASIDILNIDKNSSPDPKVISMSYLAFLYNIEFAKESNVIKFVNVMNLCLGFTNPCTKWLGRKAFLYDGNSGIEINQREFDDIRKIIMYQNFIRFDDTYIDPHLKKAMAEQDALKNKNFEIPSLERRIAIVTAHTGISKAEQLKMSYRSHTLLFEEVGGEVEYLTTRPIAVYAGKTNEMEHWIYKKSKDKLEGYIKSVDSYTQSMGSNAGKIKNAQVIGETSNLMNQFNNFNL